jgi:tetratricopeptide (TPR) repeat protein/DNA-binding XRE family transcriptional regulator
VTEQSSTSFGELLRNLRMAAGRTQEELAEISGVSARTISDLERGVAASARRDTVRRLADALSLASQDREAFAAAARRHTPHGQPARAMGTVTDAAAGEGKGRPSTAVPEQPGDDPQAWHKFIVDALEEFGIAGARSAMRAWQNRMTVDPTWLTWIETLVQLTEAGRLPPVTDRPPPGTSRGAFVGRQAEAAALTDFLNRARSGRGGLALLLGPPGIGKSRLMIEVLLNPSNDTRAEWVAFDKEEAGYRGWRRLLTPIWITLRRTELAPAGLLTHVAILDAILLPGGDSDLSSQRLPGDVAAAIAALLEHVAASEPVVVVIDDAHRGGISSDRLMLDVASQVSACRVGIIAALRPEELEEDSPIKDYCDQPEGRVALDLVVPIRLPPLGPGETASLLKARTGVEFPAKVVERVLQLTDGRPQLINNTPVQTIQEGTQAVSWHVGKLREEGLRVLDATIQRRSSQERDVLQAAALSCVGRAIDTGLVAILTELPPDSVELILDAECERGPILSSMGPGCSFQHDNWIDALIASCDLPRRRLLHAQCLAFLRTDQMPDPLRLAQHAIGAGAALVGAKDLAALTRAAADVAFADYAFGKAADLYETAARYAGGEEHVRLLIGQADALRFRGRWDDGRDALKRAASLASTLGNPELEAASLVHLERLIWTFGLDEQDIAERLRDVIGRLPPGAATLRAQAQAVLAMRLSTTARKYEAEQEDLARAALSQLPSVADSLTRADIILGIRGGLQDHDTLDEQLERDREVLRLGLKFHSAHHIVEALSAQIIDLIRSGQFSEAQSLVHDWRRFAETNPEPVIRYSLALVQGMVSLAQGEFQTASERTTEAATLSAMWGGSMANEALMAQVGWMLYETGQLEGLTEVLEEIPKQELNSLNQPLWMLSAGLIHAEKGELESARQALRTVWANTAGLERLPRGAGRIAIIAVAATVIGHPGLCGMWHPETARSWGTQIARLLSEHHDMVVIAGWPAVLLGSKNRFIGQACLAIPDPARAIAHLTRAVEENREFAALHIRTRFDLARARLLQPDSHQEAATELRQVEQDARVLGMPRLAGQAADARVLRDRPQY